MAITRKLFVQVLLGSLAAKSLGQGVVEHKGVLRPRGKPSGRPFPVRLVDVAASAGLKQRTIYGSRSPRLHP